MTRALSEDRTKNYIRQVKGSVAFKGLAIAATFLTVPLTVRYLGTEQYGIWSTMLSIMSWVVFFDLGIGNGLRNKLSESLAKQQMSAANNYISSAYTWIGLASFLIFILITLVALFIPWQIVFNSKYNSETELRSAFLITSFFILLNFWLGLINQIMTAVQKTEKVILGQFITNFLALILVYILSHTTDGSLLFIVAAYGSSMILANFLLSIIFFRRNKILIPRLSLNFGDLQPLLDIGLKFFIIQIAVLIIFTTDKIIITQLFGPQHVAQYDVVFKLFSSITIIYSLLTAPLWVAYTNAYHSNDFKWINNMLRKQFFIFIGIIILTVAMVYLTDQIINYWLGGDVDISSKVVLSIGAFIILSSWNSIYANFLNGIGEVKMQLITSIIAMLINIPLSIMLVKIFKFGVDGVMWGTIISLSIFAIIGPIQVRHIIKKNRYYK